MGEYNLTTHDFLVDVKSSRYVIVTPFEEPQEVFDFIERGLGVHKEKKKIETKCGVCGKDKKPNQIVCEACHKK